MSDIGNAIVAGIVLEVTVGLCALALVLGGLTYLLWVIFGPIGVCI